MARGFDLSGQFSLLCVRCCGCFAGAFIVASEASGGGQLRRDLGADGLCVPVALFDCCEALSGLAGVLLGKTRFDWLYGLLGELPQTVPQFCCSRFGRDGARAGAEMNKTVVLSKY